MTRSKNKICLILPAYNEARVVASVVTDLQAVFDRSKFDYQIVVIDDGSDDNTAKISKATGAKTIRHIINTGSGGATATGLSYAQQHGFNVAATLDADGQHSADDVLKGICTLLESDYDLLIGSRLINNAGMSRTKVLGNRGLSFVTFVLFGINVTDSQSGLRIFSKRALSELKWKTSGYEFCSEMLWRAKQANLKIAEYPIQAIYTDYSKVKGQNNWNGFNIVKSLVQRRIVELFGE